jgi:hypothetical protein
MAVGRKEGIYLCIDHASVSREHAEIRYANGQYILRNLSRTNGTFVNGIALEFGHASILKLNDSTLGQYTNLRQSLYRQRRAVRIIRVWRSIHIVLACAALLIILFHGIMELLHLSF